MCYKSAVSDGGFHSNLQSGTIFVLFDIPFLWEMQNET